MRQWRKLGDLSTHRQLKHKLPRELPGEGAQGRFQPELPTPLFLPRYWIKSEPTPPKGLGKAGAQGLGPLSLTNRLPLLTASLWRQLTCATPPHLQSMSVTISPKAYKVQNWQLPVTPD